MGTVGSCDSLNNCQCSDSLVEVWDSHMEFLNIVVDIWWASCHAISPCPGALLYRKQYYAGCYHLDRGWRWRVMNFGWKASMCWLSLVELWKKWVQHLWGLYPSLLITPESGPWAGMILSIVASALTLWQRSETGTLNFLMVLYASTEPRAITALFPRRLALDIVVLCWQMIPWQSMKALKNSAW